MHSVKQDLRAPPAFPAATSIVAPELEKTDPNPDVNALKAKFDKVFFHGTLGNVTVTWSNRMTRAAGYCRYRKGVCSVVLSKPLLSLRTRKDMIETLLHELIHAYFFLIGNFKEHHGPNFKNMMNLINQKAGTNISVYHTFHAEVRQHKNHWWQCNGPCKKYVRRSKNSPPKPTEWGWAKHQATCGGTFVKIAEPEKTKSGIPTGKSVKLKPLGSSNTAVPPPASGKDRPAGAKESEVTTGTQIKTTKKLKNVDPVVVVPPKNNQPSGSTKPKSTTSTVPTGIIKKPGISKPIDNQPVPSSKPAGSTKAKENKKPAVVEVDEQPDSLISVFKKMIIDSDSSAKPGTGNSKSSKNTKSKAEIPVITLDDSDDDGDNEVDIFEFEEFDSDQELDDESLIWI